MKQFLSILCAFFVFVAGVFSEDNSLVNLFSHVLMPKEVYVGDTAELRCFLKTQLLLYDKETAEVVFNEQESISEDYSIVRLELHKSAEGYELSVFFIPWKTGILSLPEIDLRVFPSVAEVFAENQTLGLLLPQVEVASLAEKLQETELRAALPPVLLPGSIYAVYIIAALAIILLILVITVCLRFKRIVFFIKNFSERMQISRNSRRILSQLRRLSKEECSDYDFACRLEGLIRLYLENRFSYPFRAVTTPEIHFAFENLFPGLLSHSQLQSVDELCGVLRRCDFVRYAADVVLEEGERRSLVDSSAWLISFFDKGED